MVGRRERDRLIPPDGLLRRRYTDSVPLVGEWLEERLRSRGISANALAGMVNKDRGQVGRWLAGKEPIPRNDLAEAALWLGSRSEMEYAMSLKSCEEFAVQLQKQLAEISRLLGLDEAQREVVNEYILAAIHRLIAQEGYLTPSQELARLTAYLSETKFCARLIIELLKSDYIEPLITAQNVTRHLAYPVNRLLGLFVDLDTTLHIAPGQEVLYATLEEFREGTLKNLRTTAKAIKVKSGAGDLARQHAVHLLARHGDTEDKQFVQELVEKANSSIDPMTKRLGFVGIILRDEADTDDILKRYIYQLNRDANLAEANLLFDAIHYRDIHIDTRGNFEGGNYQFSNAVGQMLRHLEHPEQYQRIAELELYKLNQILDKGGSRVFSSANTLDRIARLLAAMNSNTGPPGSEMQREFRKRFVQLLSEKWDPMDQWSSSDHEPWSE